MIGGRKPPDITPWSRIPLSQGGSGPGGYVRGFTSANLKNLALKTPFPVTENDIVHCVLILQGLCPGGFVRPCH